MRLYMKRFAWIFLLIAFAPTALAQTDCPTIISAALEAVDTACVGIGRNQLCYGNIQLEVTPHDSSTDMQFEQPGDIANIADVQSLHLSSFNADESTWGVALMTVQANLPDTLPGQNVTFLLFGDVAITEAGNDVVQVPFTASSGVNVRQRPSTNASVVGSLNNGQEVVATGRLSDSSWIRILLDNGTEGWVSADFVNGDVHLLLVIDPSAPANRPMQAFYFTTGISDAPCNEAPDSGILIQTPAGVGTVQLRANNVEITLGSTVYLQAVQGHTMTISVIEGHATLSAFGETQVVPAGTVSTVPLDENGLAAGAPEFPVPYDEDALQTLPLDVMPEGVAIAPAVRESEIVAAIDIANGLPPSGQWVHTETTTQIPLLSCFGDIGLVMDRVESFPTPITFSEDRSTMDILVPHFQLGWGTLTLFRSGESSYAVFSSARGGNWEFNFTSPTTYTGTIIGWREYPECSWNRALSGVFQSADE